jgi:hypothetical protein
MPLSRTIGTDQLVDEMVLRFQISTNNSVLL